MKNITFYLLRHAQGIHNTDEFRKNPTAYYDTQYMDAELTEKGIEQARNAREQFKTIVFDAIYCSPLRRCRQTLLEILPQSAHINVHLDDRLLEQPYGGNIVDKRLERDKIIETCPSAWITEQVSGLNPFKEDPELEQQNMRSFMETPFPQGNVLIVSHQTWIRRWTHMYHTHSVQLGNCEVLCIHVR